MAAFIRSHKSGVVMSCSGIRGHMLATFAPCAAWDFMRYVLHVSVSRKQGRRGSMYLEEERSEVISCIFSLKEEVGALAKALRLFEVPIIEHHTTLKPNLMCFGGLIFHTLSGSPAATVVSGLVS